MCTVQQCPKLMSSLCFRLTSPCLITFSIVDLLRLNFFNHNHTVSHLSKTLETRKNQDVCTLQWLFCHGTINPFHGIRISLARFVLPGHSPWHKKCAWACEIKINSTHSGCTLCEAHGSILQANLCCPLFHSTFSQTYEPFDLDDGRSNLLSEQWELCCTGVRWHGLQSSTHVKTVEVEKFCTCITRNESFLLWTKEVQITFSCTLLVQSLLSFMSMHATDTQNSQPHQWNWQANPSMAITFIISSTKLTKTILRCHSNHCTKPHWNS